MTANRDELNLEEMNQVTGGDGFGQTGNPAYCMHPSKHYIGGSRKENGKTLYRYECDSCHNTIWRDEEPRGGGAEGTW